MLPVQVSIPLWALVHLPVVVTITTAVFTPKGWLHCILYVLFENAMGIVKLWAVIAGPPPAALAPLHSPACHPPGLLKEAQAPDLGRGSSCHTLIATDGPDGVVQSKAASVCLTGGIAAVETYGLHGLTSSVLG